MVHPLQNPFARFGRAYRRNTEIKIYIAKINVDDAPKTAAQFKIMSIPTLILFKDGNVFEQAVGMRPKSFLQGWLKAALK